MIAVQAAPCRPVPAGRRRTLVVVWREALPRAPFYGTELADLRCGRTVCFLCALAVRRGGYGHHATVPVPEGGVTWGFTAAS